MDLFLVVLLPILFYFLSILLILYRDTLETIHNLLFEPSVNRMALEFHWD